MGGVTPREFIRRARRDGFGGLVRRGAYELYHRSGADVLESAIAEDDLADPLSTPPRPRVVLADGEVPRIGWVCTAPGPGSGGHTTLFRMIAGAERHGFESTLFLYDERGGDVARHERVIRENWPWVHARVRDAAQGITGVHAAVASSWETAHVLARRAGHDTARLYFVQDFEPFFHARGSHYALAEDSYRLGHRTIALGGMVQDALADIGVDSELAPFGRDRDVYRLRNTGDRRGVVFYAKRGNDRRGYLLGKLALRRFHERHPEQPIHVYGDDVADWPIPIVSHGRLTPAELDALYNEVVGGIALSFTNITLVAEEMLAAGAIPVINDHRYARADLQHPEAVWAAPSAGALAEALCAVVEAPDRRERSVRAATIDRVGWNVAQDVVVSVIRDELGVRAAVR